MESFGWLHATSQRGKNADFWEGVGRVGDGTTELLVAVDLQRIDHDNFSTRLPGESGELGDQLFALKMSRAIGPHDTDMRTVLRHI
jgi:hypothetical protein